MAAAGAAVTPSITVQQGSKERERAPSNLSYSFTGQILVLQAMHARHNVKLAASVIHHSRANPFSSRWAM